MRPRPTTECKSLDLNTGGASPWAAIKWQCTYTKTLDEVQPLRKLYMYYICVSKQDESHS